MNEQDFVYETEQVTIEHRRASGEDKKRVLSLDSVDLKIRRGSRTAVLGISGSGKSTLLFVLGSLRSSRSCSASGQIWYRGYASPRRDVLALTAQQAEIYRGQELGFVLPDSPLLGNLTCLHNLCLPLLRFGHSWAYAKSHVHKYVEQIDKDALGAESERKEQVPKASNPATIRSETVTDDEGLMPHLNKYPSQLSSGQRQRFAVLRSIVHNPEVILADEPFSNLDPFNHLKMLTLLAHWQQVRTDEGQRPTIVLVSHHWETALNWAEEVLVLWQGKLSGERTFDAERLKDPELLQQLLFGRFSSGNLV